jgi:hypothetical protein
VTEQFLIRNQLLHVPHPPYSPDLAPLDFWLFGRIKIGVAGRSSADPEGLLEGVLEFLERIPAAELTVVLEGWIDRVRWVIGHNGQYYSSSMLSNQFKFPIVRPWLCCKKHIDPRMCSIGSDEIFSSKWSAALEVSTSDRCSSVVFDIGSGSVCGR